MAQIERSFAGVPWLLLAIYVVLTGGELATSYSPLVELTFTLSLLPAIVGVYLTIREQAPAAEE